MAGFGRLRARRRLRHPVMFGAYQRLNEPVTNPAELAKAAADLRTYLQKHPRKPASARAMFAMGCTTS